MHDLFQPQRAYPDSPGNHHAEGRGQRCGAQPGAEASARDFSAQPRGPAARMGRSAQPAVEGARSSFRHTGTGGVAPFSPAVSGEESGGERGRARRRAWQSALKTMKSAALGLIRFYQTTLGPAFSPSVCRFTPSCSAFAYEAIEKWGVVRGIGLSARRLFRCRPFGGCGYDPVP